MRSTARGTARRRPDVLSKELDLGALAETQAALLDAAWRCLKPGGLLVFSSCSALTADAEQSFAAFLQRTADAHLVRWLEEVCLAKGSCLPPEDPASGYLAARMQFGGLVIPTPALVTAFTLAQHMLTLRLQVAAAPLWCQP